MQPALQGSAPHWGVQALGGSAASSPHLVAIHHLDDHALPQVGIQDDSLAALLPHDHPRPACTPQQSVSAVLACPNISQPISKQLRLQIQLQPARPVPAVKAD